MASQKHLHTFLLSYAWTVPLGVRVCVPSCWFQSLRQLRQ